MARYLTKRLSQVAVTLFFYFTLVYFLISLQPGNFCDILAQQNPHIPPDELERICKLFGEDKPLLQKYLINVKNYATGNFGFSFSKYPTLVTDIIKERLPRTLALFVTAAVLSSYMGFTLGKLIAWRRSGVTEYAATLGGVTLYTIFTPWFALMLMWVFAVKADWFPLGKFLDPLVWLDADVEANYVFMRLIATAALISLFLIGVYIYASHTRFKRKNLLMAGSSILSLVVMLVAWNASGIGYLAWDIVKHMALPIMTLTLISFAGMMLLTRNSMLETMREDFVLAARAKGLPDKMVRDKHVARNAMLPVVTSFLFALAFAIDGGIIIENVFSWPGMGQTLLEAVLVKDIPLAVATFIFTGLFILAAHFFADMLHMYLDPRLRPE